MIHQCAIPKVDPHDPELMQFDWHPDSLICASWIDLVYIDSQGYLQMNNTAISISKFKNVVCKYRIIRRVNDFKITLEDEEILSSPVFIQADFVHVYCNDTDNKEVYSKIHINVDFKSVQKARNLTTESESNLSVLIFGVDSLSRISAEKRLVTTMKFLKSLPGTFIFEGYTKVEESTFVNLVPVFTGKAPIPRLVNINSWREPLDPIPFMWKDFKAKGMPVLYAEDWVQYGTFALQKGFTNPIFDHYFRMYLLAINQIHSTSIDGTLCYGNTPKANSIIEYLKRFVAGYGNHRKFAFSWINAISHDEPNNLELVDGAFSEFFMWLYKNGHLNNTVLIFFSDHGPRHSKLRKTVVGRIEDRMPLLSIVFPEHVLLRNPHLTKVLMSNSQRLTTAYDLHETLVNILESDFRYIKSNTNATARKHLPRGISLFRDIPKWRTCSDAAIKEEFCPCYKSNPIAIDDPVVLRLAQYLVQKINSILSGIKSKCAVLNLKSIETASIVSSNYIVKETAFMTFLKYFRRNSNPTKYSVAIQTEPGDAMFESTILYKTSQDFKVLGDIFRINKFGNQSDCVPERFLKSYCFCK